MRLPTLELTAAGRAWRQRGRVGQPEPDEVAPEAFGQVGHVVAEVVGQPRAVRRLWRRRVTVRVAAGLQDHAPRTEPLAQLDPAVPAAGVQPARDAEGDPGESEGTGALVLVGPGGRVRPDEVAAHPEDLVHPAQVRRRVALGVVEDEEVQLLGREAGQPRLQAAEELAVGEDLGRQLAGGPEVAVAREVPLAPQVQVVRPGALDGVAQAHEQRRRGEHVGKPLGGERVRQVGRRDIADRMIAGAAAEVVIAGAAAEVVRVPLQAPVEVPVEEEDLVDVGGDVDLGGLPQALVEPVGAAFRAAGDDEVGQEQPPARRGHRHGHAGRHDRSSVTRVGSGRPSSPGCGDRAGTGTPTLAPPGVNGLCPGGSKSASVDTRRATNRRTHPPQRDIDVDGAAPPVLASRCPRRFPEVDVAGRNAADLLVPVTLVVGDEELLVSRAVGEVVGAAGAADPAADVRDVDASTLEPGLLLELTSPSLFAQRRVLVLRGAEALGKDAGAELATYAATPAPDVHVVVTHPGGARGRALLDALTKAGARRVACTRLTRAGDREQFVRAEFRAARRRVTDDGVRALLDAVGSDLRAVANACAQLVADTEGTVDAETVFRYHSGRAEVSGF